MTNDKKCSECLHSKEGHRGKYGCGSGFGCKCQSYNLPVEDKREEVAMISADSVGVLNMCVDDLEQFTQALNGGKLNVLVHYVDEHGIIVPWNPTKEPQNQDWVKRFYEKFTHSVDGKIWLDPTTNYQTLKKFISSLLLETEQRVKRELAEEIEMYFGHIQNNGVDGNEVQISLKEVAHDILELLK